MKTDWDYSDRAATYDKRADYNEQAIELLISETNCSPQKPVADIGAGTGKLTKVLANFSLSVCAVEPNDNMRMYGKKNTSGMDVTWSEGTGEQTGLDSSSYHAAFFGSSFNVTDQKATLQEIKRILVPRGWFACMWNHRDLDDPLQKKIEGIIHSFIPSYSYGSRRQNPTAVLDESGLFNHVQKIEQKFTVTMEAGDIVEAWRSHDTLFRQSSGQFDKIINSISEELVENKYDIPYFTRIWYSRLKN